MNYNREIAVVAFILFTVINGSVNINAHTLQQLPPSNDSVQNNELEEFVVIAQNQRSEAGGLVFLPTRRQKEMAQDGYDLLRHLAIPQIKVSPTEENVTTIAGGDVSIFINGQEASSSELEALKTTDVMRVDYLDFPSDPKFGGAQHVLNIIVKKLQSGGYSRIFASSKLLNKTSVETNVFSKFAFKRMVYDLYIGYDYLNSHHSALSTTENFSLINNEDKPYEITRNNECDFSRKRTWNLPLSFRAIYQSDKFQASNQVSFTFGKTPIDLTKGSLSFSSGIAEKYSNKTSYSSTNTLAGWNGIYDFDFDDGCSLNLNSNVLYIHNNSHNTYSSDIKGFDSIITNARENLINFDISAAARKQFSDEHSVLITTFFKYYNNKIEYSGSSVFDSHQFETTSRIGAAYELNLPVNLMMHIDAGANWQKSKSSDVKRCLLTPYATLFASYAPEPHHQLNLTFNYLSLILPESLKTGKTLQINELMYATGNPSLKSFPQISGSFMYTWLPMNNFYITAMATYYEAFDSPVTVYTHFQEGNALLRSYNNDGHYIFQFYGLQFTYKPIDNLQLELGALHQDMKDKCKTGRSVNNFTANARISYYMDKFYIAAAGSLSSKYYEPIENSINKAPTSYSFTGGWSNGIWNVKISAENIFSNSWKSTSSNVSLPLYSKSIINYDGAVHRSISFGVSYTFGYGKKVSHGDEIGAQEQPESAVLK